MKRIKSKKKTNAIEENITDVQAKETDVKEENITEEIKQEDVQTEIVDVVDKDKVDTLENVEKTSALADENEQSKKSKGIVDTQTCEGESVQTDGEDKVDTQVELEKTSPIRKGSVVEINGRLYGSSRGECPQDYIEGEKLKVIEIDKENKYCYKTEKGWASQEAVKK